MKAMDFDLTPSVIKQALVETAKELAEPCDGCGAGVVDAFAAVSYIQNCLVEGCSGKPIQLFNGQARSGFSIKDEEDVVEFFVDIPEEGSNLKIAIVSEAGDADLYVQFDEVPTEYTFDCAPYLSGSEETCRFTHPSPGTYRVIVKGFYGGFTDLLIVASWDEFSEAIPLVVNGEEVKGLSANQGQDIVYRLEVTADTILKVQTYGGLGDADIYVAKNKIPTATDYDCRSWTFGNNESCELPASVGGYYLKIKAYEAFSGLNMNVEW